MPQMSSDSLLMLILRMSSTSNKWQVVPSWYGRNVSEKETDCFVTSSEYHQQTVAESSSQQSLKSASLPHHSHPHPHPHLFTMVIVLLVLIRLKIMNDDDVHLHSAVTPCYCSMLGALGRVYLFIYWRLTAPSTTQGHLRAFHKFKSRTNLETKKDTCLNT